MFISFLGNAQISFDKVKYDFGDLEAYSSRYVDIILSNEGTKQEWILSVKKPMDVVYITSKQIIEKDSSVVVRLQVNPKEKGRFSYEVNIFTSDRGEATTIKLQGNLREVSQDNMAAFNSCPNFNEREGGRDPNNFDLTVVTIDKESRDELSRSAVTMIQNGEALWSKYTDKKGKIKEDATLGLSYFYATHDGYHPAELGAYVNFKRNYIVVELEKDPTWCEIPPSTPEPIPVPEIDTTVIAYEPPVTPEPEVEIVIEDHLETLETEEDSSFIADVPISFTDLDKENFDEEHFKPVNVVFVLDVSASMKQVDKMELMKYSLFQLTEMLRPQDKIGIVTYANDARVLLNPTRGDLKDDIKKEVSALKAFGYTSGGSGIKLGFKEAKKSMIADGTNHIIVITDGAFNRNSDDYKKYIKKYKKKGINMSVVGIKNKDVAEEKMRAAAELGGGHFVGIQKLADAKNNLKQEIRRLTYRH
ncbi:MAG: VWA domain-containing protein [Crocinitomicaceae bacterium]